MASGAVVTFLGGTGTVTGSKFLVETEHARVLVDCGLFQGPKPLRLRNWEPVPLDPSTLDAVVLTHAHLDHSGYLPALARSGFAGPVYATPGTVELVGIVLADSGHLQEEDAAYANRAGFSKHRPALPLYTEADAIRSLDLLHPVELATARVIAPGVELTLRRAGHILGAASVVLRVDGDPECTVVVSGDLGRDAHPLLLPPEPPPAADAMLVESTYGGRHHADDDSVSLLADAVVRTARRGGTVVVPAFAVDRTEIVLFHLARLMGDGDVPALPVYVDSPMALAALDVYHDALAAGSPELRPELTTGADPLRPPHLEAVRTVEESKALDRDPVPKIIVSASGMATGGRVLHHLARYLPDTGSTVVLVGFQAEGTRGRLLQQGARVLKMLGRYVPVRAEMVDVAALSAHADHDELVAWVRSAPRAPDTVFVVHGEPEAADALRDAVAADPGWAAVVPRHGERVRVG